MERDFKSGVLKINFLTLQEKYGEYTNDLNRTKLERECRLKYFYYMELCQVDPSLRADSNFDIISYEQLFADLKTKIIDVKLLEKISKDFYWNFQKVLAHQVSLFKIKIVVPSSIFNQHDVVSDNNHFKHSRIGIQYPGRSTGQRRIDREDLNGKNLCLVSTISQSNF